MNGVHVTFVETANDSAYMNTAANFRGATHTSDTGVDLFFQAAAVWRRRC